MANLRENRRKDKRFINWIRKKAGYGKYCIDCRYHPCLVTEIEFYKNDLYGNGCFVKSLINDMPNSCSYMHCGIEPISKQKAEEMADFAKNNSWEDYLRKYHNYDDAAIENFRELDKEWNFQKNN